MKKHLYLVRRPAMKGCKIPMFNYTYADNAEAAIKKVRLKYGEYDEDIVATIFNFTDDVVIGSDYFG